MGSLVCIQDREGVLEQETSRNTITNQLFCSDRLEHTDCNDECVISLIPSTIIQFRRKSSVGFEDSPCIISFNELNNQIEDSFPLMNIRDRNEFVYFRNHSNERCVSVQMSRPERKNRRRLEPLPPHVLETVKRERECRSNLSKQEMGRFG